MKRIARDLGFLIVAGVILWQCAPAWFGINPSLGRKDPPSAATLNTRIQLPDGFTITLFASNLPNARLLRFTPTGALLVSLPRSGRVVLLQRDENGDGRPDGRRTLLSGLKRPHGLDLHGGWLYVAETDAIVRIRIDPQTSQTAGDIERVVTGLPGGGNHWSRTVRVGPDGSMYVSVGSSCNACEEHDPRRAALLRFSPDGGRAESYATGLRNTVGFDWRPRTGELYGVDNGRDFLGDDFPPCELNRIEQGGFYGWPYANGNRVPDPDFGTENPARVAASIPPVHAFGAHTAPLGITFLHTADWPDAYRDSALVALHGSWNRSKKSGYKVVSLHFAADGSVSEQDFATGFELNGDVIGRPVDVAEGPDGALYISDDYTGSIYRVVYSASR